MSNSQQRFGLAQINASLAHVLHSLQPFRARISFASWSNFFLRLIASYWILLILELFIRDSDILSPGTKLLYDDLSDFRVIIVVYIFFGMIVSVVPCIFVRVTGRSLRACVCSTGARVCDFTLR